MYATIAFPISRYQTFTYAVPASLKAHIAVGVRVRAPLGTRMVQGIVVATSSTTDFHGKIREIQEQVDDQPVLDQHLWELIQWLSRYYFTPLGQVARAVLPGKLSTKYSPPTEFLVSTRRDAIDWTLVAAAPVQQTLLKVIAEHDGWLSVRSLGTLASSPLTVCRRLAEKGLVEMKEEIRKPDATGFTFQPVHKSITFSSAQQDILNPVYQSLEKKKFSRFLLHGVTGSGKTELYIAAARKALDLDYSVIVLLPEISLTPQIGGRFRAEFGEQVGLWHSRMSPALRAWTWKRMCAGDYRVIVGARSAVFAPLKKLGLIVVDEEQESSYKQESPPPRYHARDVAVMRCKLHRATVILSSATPSLESYYNQVQGKFTYLHLPERFGGSLYPTVHVVNMLQENEESGKTGQVLSGILLDKIEDRLRKGEQVLILQNRRGYAPVVHCYACGESIMCPNCNITLTYHKIHHGLHCHFCGYTSHQIPDSCPSCANPELRLTGTGVQRVEELLRLTFPAARVLRLDRDTTSTATKLTKTLESFARGEGDILVGTQMIAKGLDFGRVTLAGIINADTGLLLPDFRSGERIFQLIYQTAGRTGRRQVQGEVIIQSYNADNPVIKYAVRLNLKGYYNLALSERQELNYPPFSWIIKLEAISEKKQQLEKQIQSLRQLFPQPYKGLEILGPAYCYRDRLHKKYRMQIIFKSAKIQDPSGTRLHNYVEQNVLPRLNETSFRSLAGHLDIDPVSML
ncbi:MAG: primosomal protein N' [Fidelibacterota bacterium]